MIDRRSQESREALGVVRHKLRAPLHKMISCAELVAESDLSHSDPKIETEVSKFLESCEATLHHIYLIFESSTINRGDVLSSVCSTVSEFLADVRRIAQELKRLARCHKSAMFTSDVDKLSQSILSFEEIFANLTSISNQDSAITLQKDTYSSILEPAHDQLIIQVEYSGLILVVDDDEANRDVLSRRLLRDRYEVMLAESGRQALRMLNRYDFDLVLLDIMMPEMDGMAVLAELKRNPNLYQLPVIMITAVDEIETIARCIESGADDYLLKPFNPVLLRARINALLERKRLQDEQKRQRSELEIVLEDSKKQKEKAEQLLLNILPAVIAQELREFGSVKPMYFEDVTIVFADIVGFTLSTEHLPADELVEALNDYFTRCDRVMSRYSLEKLKTIGDCYMFAGGIPVRNPSHPVDCVLAAMEMIQAMHELRSEGKVAWQLRIGIHTGPVIAGVVGIHKFAFDIWGDSVNFTSRVESCGTPDRINLSASTYARVKDFFSCDKRDPVRIKEGKEVEMYFVGGLAAGLLSRPNMSELNAFQARYSTYFRKEMRTFPEYLFDPGRRVTEDTTNGE